VRIVLVFTQDCGVRNSQRPRSVFPRRVVVWLALILTLVAGCVAPRGGEPGSEPSAGNEVAPVVVATTSIWADVVGNVACGDLAEIRQLIPPGADPHGFEPSLADRVELEGAVLVVANGLRFEAGLADTLAEVERGGTRVFWFGDQVDPIPLRGATNKPKGESADPHVWLDPMRVAAALPALATQLEAAGLPSEKIRPCVVAYQKELAALDAQLEEMAGSVPASRRAIVTNHDSLGYLANRYGFEIAGTVIPGGSSLAEANPAQLQDLATLMEDRQIKVIFADEAESIAVAEALAARLTIAEIVELRIGTLGRPGTPADSYVGNMVDTMERIVNGLDLDL